MLMFFPESRLRVFLDGQSADMRKSFDGRATLTLRGLRQDPLSGHVFFNRRGSYLKPKGGVLGP